MPWCFSFRSNGLHCGVHGTAALMPEHDNQSRAQNIDRVLDASQAFIVEHIASYSNDEQVSEAFIKDEFGRHTRIRTTKDDRKRVLTLRQFCASFGGLFVSHAQGNRTGIFIAVGRHVLSFINRFVRMLRISGSESSIAFLEPRHRLGRRNNWLIGMFRISCSAKLISANQGGDDETECELRLSHAGDLRDTSPARSIESQKQTVASYPVGAPVVSLSWKETEYLL